MRIAIVTGPFIPFPPGASGAVEKTWFVLAQEFVRQGHEVTLVGCSASGTPAEEVVNGVRLIRHGGFARTGSTLRDLFLDYQYSRSIRSRVPNADILVTNGFFQPVTFRDHQRRGARIVIHMARFPKRQTRLYLHADCIQVPSEPIRAAVIEQCPKAAPLLTVVDYPVDCDVFQPAPERRSQEPTILYAGRVHPEKGVHLLAEAASRLRTPVTLRIAGPVEVGKGGGGDEYASRIRQLAGAQRTEFLGNLAAPADLAREMQSATAFCYPSLAERGETFGIAPLEALAAGCPTVVSALEVFRAHVKDGETGLVFDHRSNDPVDTLTRQVERIFADSALRDSLAERGAQHAKSFSVPLIAKRHLRDFESLLKSAPQWQKTAPQLVSQ